MVGNKQYFITGLPKIIFEYGLNIKFELKLFFAKLYLFTSCLYAQNSYYLSKNYHSVGGKISLTDKNLNDTFD
jgi:hypothetical protein